jgi:hypothetical protein
MTTAMTTADDPFLTASAAIAPLETDETMDDFVNARRGISYIAPTTYAGVVAALRFGLDALGSSDPSPMLEEAERNFSNAMATLTALARQTV